MEQIYTIPVNEAFDKTAQDPKCGCPFCTLYKKLQDDELTLILGASMMEPDIRIKTNEQGFCLSHYRGMLGRRRRLGMGLMLESHLPTVKKLLDEPLLPIGTPGARSVADLSRLEGDCYVCRRIAHNLDGMCATAVYLYESDPLFKKKVEATPFFCLPHYRMLIAYAQKKMNKKVYREFYSLLRQKEEACLDALSGDVSWFCKKFDYRYDEEPWYNSKDAIERAIRFLSSDTGVIGDSDSSHASS